MPIDQKLEQYLAHLDKKLGQIPTSDRADIVTEIKSHVLSALDKDPTATVSSVLAGLGEPEAVANRYLIERGLKPVKPSKSPMIKWLTIGFLGTFTIFMLTVLALIWKFSPLLKIDEENGRVVLLGGLIDIDEKKGTLSIGSTKMLHDQDLKVLEGTKPIKDEKIEIKFGNGKVETSPSIDDQLHWKCKYSGSIDNGGLYEEKKLLRLDLTKSPGVKCEIQLPKAPVEIDGANGKVRIVHTQAQMKVKLLNGKVEVMPHPNVNYRYKTEVTNGSMENLESSTAKDAIPVEITIGNGKISVDR